MLTIDQGIIGAELSSRHLYETSWEALGLSYDIATAEEVIAASTEELMRPPVDEGQRREARAISNVCTAAAKRLAAPLIDHIFADEKFDGIRNKWGLFGVNYYETGDMFPPHRDLNNPDLMTIVIISLSGVRKLRVEDNPTIKLLPGSITLLDGATNPVHSAWCEQGPSISVVADIPELLY